MLCEALAEEAVTSLALGYKMFQGIGDVDMFDKASIRRNQGLFVVNTDVKNRNDVRKGVACSWTARQQPGSALIPQNCLT